MAKRLFPSYTIAELRTAALNTERNSPEQIALLNREIAARESGASTHKVTPQIDHAAGPLAALHRACAKGEPIVEVRATLVPRFNIGTQFKSAGKHPRLCTVVEVLRTFNSKDELVRIRYVATHPGPIGGVVTDYDVCDTTIARGKLAEA